MKITREHLKNIVRETLQEESEYQEFFKKALEKAGKSIPAMSDEEKKKFFNNIEKTWSGRGKKNERFGRGDETELDELTKAQEKLPPALKKAIEKKEDKKESVDESTVNEAKKEIQGKHAGNYVKGAKAGRTIEINGVIYTSLSKGKWKGPDGKKLNWIEISAMASALGNKKVVYESVNEGPSTEEKRIAMLAVRKQAKYRNVSLEQAIQDQINALEELKRDAKRGKLK